MANSTADPQAGEKPAEPPVGEKAVEPPVGDRSEELRVGEPRRRLHPLSPLLRGARLAVVVIAGISWQGYQNLGFQRWLMAVVSVAVPVLVWSVVIWYVTGYHVVGRELRVYEGLLSRRTRAIPLERLQSVELVRPVLARLFGLAELRLEVVGAAKTEAPLAFLTVDEATALRERLLAISRGGPSLAIPVPGPSQAGPGQAGPSQAGPGQAAPGLAAEQPERHIQTVANRDLVISQLLRPHWWFLPLAVAAPVVLFATGSDVGFVATASMLTAIVGVVQAPVRAVLNDWRFTLAAAQDGLHVRRGLLETRAQTVPRGRVQVVGVQWPLLWRGYGWVRAQMHIAGASAGEGSEQRASLLPVGDVATAEAVIAEVLPGFVLRSVAVLPVPARVRWIAPLRRYVLGYQLADTAFVTRDGLLTRRLVVVPYGRIQSVRVRQGPLQRLLRVASVWADTAGGGLNAVAEHRDVAEAVALATALADRSRTARHAQSAPPRRPHAGTTGVDSPDMPIAP
jgi:putative membrane protein